MLEQRICEYLQAVRRREEAVKRFTELTEVVAEAAKQMAEALKNTGPGNPRMTRISTGLGAHGSIADAHRWPTADAIQKARQELLAAASQVDQAWHAIPQEQRLGLSPPNGQASPT